MRNIAKSAFPSLEASSGCKQGVCTQKLTTDNGTSSRRARCVVVRDRETTENSWARNTALHWSQVEGQGLQLQLAELGTESYTMSYVEGARRVPRGGQTVRPQPVRFVNKRKQIFFVLTLFGITVTWLEWEGHQYYLGWGSLMADVMSMSHDKLNFIWLHDVWCCISQNFIFPLDHSFKLLSFNLFVDLKIFLVILALFRNVSQIWPLANSGVTC